jgi:alpha-tubulin suppressor-like RCC1 family protein
VAVASADQGDGHSCAVAVDGRVFCWGVNEEGELGDGSTTNRFIADVPVVGIADATSVSAGIRFTCATRADGSTWCWGEDPGSDLSHSTPQRVEGVANAVAVSAGGAHACALRQNGTVLCWGLGSLGQLGNGTFESNSGVPTPQVVVGIDDAVQIAAGWNHTCALIRGGTIECWGGNGDGATGYGQLGDGTFDNRAAPVQVLGISEAVEVAAGGWTTCAVIRGGSVRCWGYGERGGLGNGTRANSPSPVGVSDITDARSVAVGQFHACAQRSGGLVACWGDVGWGGGGSSSVPVNGGANVGNVQLSTDQSLLLVDDAGQLLEWRLGSDDGPNPVAVGP